jgi:hypothetical protein
MPVPGNSGLFNILGRILLIHYTQPDSLALDDNVGRGLKSALEHWRYSLPKRLLLESYPDTSTATQQCLMLTLRFYAVRMLLYKASVQNKAEANSATKETSFFTTSFGSSGAALSLSLSDAMETIDLLARTNDQNSWNKTGAAWYRLFFGQ